jgi:hypothetical protein
LLALAGLAVAIAVFRIGIDTHRVWNAKDPVLDYTTSSLLLVAILAVLLLRVGPLLRVKWGSVEAEFTDLMSTVQNNTELSSKDLIAKLEELRVLVSQVTTAGSGPALVEKRIIPPPDPPGLKRSQRYGDDPWKGRFGGKASNGEYTLSASFKEKASGFVGVVLTVATSNGDKPDRTVEYFLHPTLSHERTKVRMIEGKARLSLIVWGGFTVGVWIPDDQVELELDLAELPHAPPAIREK